MTDNYEFMKSTEPQGVDLETPYVSKNYSYVSDINQGVYSNNGLSLVQFDLSSIYNSTGFIGTSDMFLTIPLVYCQAFTTDTSTGALVAPTANGFNWARLGLKAGYWNLLQSADLQVNGKTIEQYQPNLNVYTTIKMLSQMSQDDLNSYGYSLGLGSTLDTPNSLRFGNTASATGAGAYPLGTGSVGGNGGSGTASSITGSSVTYAGGGGGGANTGTAGVGGAGGGGAGALNGTATVGTANTGGGGGGSSGPALVAGPAGGSGVVILSVPTTKYSGTTTGSPTITTSGANTIIKFTGTGTYTA